MAEAGSPILPFRRGERVFDGSGVILISIEVVIGDVIQLVDESADFVVFAGVHVLGMVLVRIG